MRKTPMLVPSDEEKRKTQGEDSKKKKKKKIVFSSVPIVHLSSDSDSDSDTKYEKEKEKERELDRGETSNSEDVFVVYTDGACSGNPGPGGWAWAVSEPHSLRRSGGERNTTNQRMELTAVLDALQVLTQDRRGAIQIVSDSKYVVDCFHKKWWKAWKRNGWQTASKKPVANRDLWQPLLDLALQHNVTFVWVRGHSGNRMNELVDSLAVNAIPR